MSLAPRAASEAGLWLYVRAALHLMALPADHIERALLVEETPAPRWPAALGPSVSPRGCQGLLAVRGASYGAWDLGVLLGSVSARSSWVLLRLPHAQGVLPMALRTDECLHVGVLPRLRGLDLPAGVWGSRAVFRAAFHAADLGAARSGEALVGLEVDPGGLWTDYELEFTRELLRQAAAEGAAGHV